MPAVNPEIYLKIFERAPIGMAISDEKGLVVDMNEALLRMGGWKREELQGVRSDFFYYDGPAYREEVVALARRQGGFLDRHELRFKKKDGTFFWALMSLRMAVIEGRPHFVAIIEDETELKETKRIFTIAAKAARVGVWYSDPTHEGRLIWSDESYEIFGFTKETFDGRVETFFKTIHPQDMEAVTRASKDALAGGSRYNVEHRIIRKDDGAVRWVHQEAEVIFDPNGRPLQMIGMVQDITAAKTFQEEREKYTRELERVTRTMVGREVKMVDLKKRVKELEMKLGIKPPAEKDDDERG